MTDSLYRQRLEYARRERILRTQRGYRTGILRGSIGGLGGAARLLGSEADGLAIDFRDMSIVIRDTTTPANNFSGHPSAKLLGDTLTGTSSGLTISALTNIYLPTSAFPYSSTAFSIVAMGATSALAINALVALNASGGYSGGPGALLRIENNSAVTAGGNATAASKGISPLLAANEMIKVGAAFRTAGNNISVTNRGQAVTTIATSDWDGSSNRLQIGAITSGGAQSLLGTLAWLVYLPRYDTAEIVTRST